MVVNVGRFCQQYRAWHAWISVHSGQALYWWPLNITLPLYHPWNWQWKLKNSMSGKVYYSKFRMGMVNYSNKSVPKETCITCWNKLIQKLWGTDEHWRSDVAEKSAWGSSHLKQVPKIITGKSFIQILSAVLTNQRLTKGRSGHFYGNNNKINFCSILNITKKQNHWIFLLQTFLKTKWYLWDDTIVPFPYFNKHSS